MLQAMNMRAATFDDVALVVLATRDENAARGFVARVLGPLAAADTEVRETLRIYIREGCSASRAAAALFSHRNTVVNRIQRAEALLPEPLRGRSVEVGAALEMNRWIGRDA
jgi:DNA-binding PucR family transcriptional regulator